MGAKGDEWRQRTVDSLAGCLALVWLHGHEIGHTEVDPVRWHHHRKEIHLLSAIKSVVFTLEFLSPKSFPLCFMV